MKNYRSFLKSFYSILFITFLGAASPLGKINQAHAQASAGLSYLKLSNGRYMAYEKGLYKASEPTLVLLPGVFRGLLSKDPAVQLLKKQKINFVTLHFSAHPESLYAVPVTETAAVKLINYSSKDFSEEVLALVNFLKIKNPVFVGLSYSSSVASLLAENETLQLPLVIETAPMIRFDEANPTGGQISEFWKNWFNLNPFLGPFFSQWYLKQTYQQHWQKHVEQMAEQNEKLNNFETKDKLISGFTQLSMAVHGFDYSQKPMTAKTPRAFILGQNELENRMILQKQAITRFAEKTKIKPKVYFLEGAGHIVPNDQPETYVESLLELLETIK